MLLLTPCCGLETVGLSLGGKTCISFRVVSKLLFSSTTFTSSNRKVVDIAASEGELRVFLVAGEVSGDSIGSRLMASLKKLSPFPVRFAGVGGLVSSIYISFSYLKLRRLTLKLLRILLFLYI